MHSVKNRFLMRIKNISGRSLPAQLALHHRARLDVVVMCCLLWEHTSLKAFWLPGEATVKTGAGPSAA
jgi:hypothetical protein